MQRLTFNGGRPSPKSNDKSKIQPQLPTSGDKWRQLNAIKRTASRLGIQRRDDDGEMEIFLLWAKLRAEYARRHQK